MSKKLSAKILAGAVALGMLALVFAPSSAGAQSIDELLAQIANLQAQLLALQGGGSGAGCYAFSQDLTLGATGAEVVELQKALVAGGYLTMPTGVAMGYFGPLTQAAVAAWQAANGVAPAAGYWGPISRGAYAAKCVPAAPGDGDGDGDGDFFGGSDEGYLDEFDQLSGFSSEEVGEDEEDVEVLGVEFEAVDAAQMVERVIVEIDTPTGGDDLEDFISDVSVWLDGKELGRMDVDDGSHDRSADEYTFRFTNLKGIVDDGDLAELTVAVTGVRNLDSGDAGNGWTVTIPADGIRASSPNGVVDEYDSSAYDEPFTVETFASATGAELKVNLSNDNPDAHVVNVDLTDDTDGVELLVGTLEAKGSDLTIFEFPVLLTVTGVADVDLIANRLTLEIDGKSYSETVSTAGVAVATITFDNLELDIPEGDKPEFTVSADVNDLEGTFGDGDTLKAEIRASERAAIEVEDESGTDLAAGDRSGTALGEEVAFYDIGIFVTLTDTDRTVAVDDGADNDTGTFIISFEVEAFDGTVYVSDSADATTAASIADTTISGDGMLYLVEDSGTATTDDLADIVTYVDVSGDATDSTNGVKLDDGEVAEFTLTVTQTNDSAEDDGIYRMLLKAIGWNLDDSTTWNVYDFDLEDYKTSPISLN